MHHGLPRRGLVAALVSLVATTLLVACTSAVGQQAAAIDGEPVDGGTIRLTASDDLTPSLFYSGTKSAEVILTGLVYDRLVAFPADSLQPQPDLATSWQLSEDHRRITLDLREDVTFHSGRPMTSADVEFSLRTYADPANAGQLAHVAGLITSYDTSSPHRITLELSEPSASLFDLLSIVPIIDEETHSEWQAGEEYIGTGAFTFDTWYPGSRITFRANEDYWGGAPRVDGAELLIIPDQLTQFTQLRAGQVDILTDATPRDAAAVESTPLFRVDREPGSATNTYIGTNVSAPELADPRIRRAISLAVDRERIVQEVYQGRADERVLPWPESSPAFPGDKALRHRDVDTAQRLVQEAGEPETINISFAATSLPHRDIAQILASNLAEIGLSTTLEQVEYATMVQRLRAGEFAGLWVMDHGFAQYNPATLLSSAFPFNPQRNGSNFSSAEYAAQVERLSLLPDSRSAEAQEAYREVNELLLDESFVIEVAQPYSEVLTAGNLHDLKWTKRGEFDLSDAYFTR